MPLPDPVEAAGSAVTLAGMTNMIGYEERMNLLTEPGALEIEEEIPLRVAPDWDEQLRRANELTRALDRHLDYEARGRLLLDPQDFRPQHLCPEQRVQCLTDIYALARE
jgi:hypothetical protein